jgi:hypothetical protein
LTSYPPLNSKLKREGRSLLAFDNKEYLVDMSNKSSLPLYDFKVEDG